MSRPHLHVICGTDGPVDELELLELLLEDDELPDELLLDGLLLLLEDEEGRLEELELLDEGIPLPDELELLGAPELELLGGGSEPLEELLLEDEEELLDELELLEDEDPPDDDEVDDIARPSMRPKAGKWAASPSKAENGIGAGSLNPDRSSIAFSMDRHPSSAGKQIARGPPHETTPD